MQRREAEELFFQHHLSSAPASLDSTKNITNKQIEALRKNKQTLRDCAKTSGPVWIFTTRHGGKVLRRVFLLFLHVNTLASVHTHTHTKAVTLTDTFHVQVRARLLP